MATCICVTNALLPALLPELAVNIRVSYTPPPGFIPGPNEYRAASGPVTVTCIAVGGTETLNYQWSSNCRDCPFRSASSSKVIRGAVNSGDTGTHTCTADGSRNGSAAITFKVVGRCNKRGMHA